MNRYLNIPDHYHYYRSHSVSSKSSICSIEADKRKKCSNCSIWLNLSRIFEFLVTGKLDEMIPTESFDADLTHLYYLVDQLKYIRNPIDPSDLEDFLWNFKSPLHYKLLKLKLKLLNQIDQLIKIFQINENSCKKCSKESKNFLLFKSFSINKLDDYVINVKPVLERLYDRFFQYRFKNSFDINSSNDLNHFMRIQHPIHEPIYDPSLQLVDLCATKIHSLIDLLIYDDFGYQKFKRPIHDFRIKPRNETKKELGNQEFVNYDFDIDLEIDLIKKDDEKKKITKRSISVSSLSSVTGSEEEQKSKKKSKRKKSGKKSKKRKIESEVKIPSSSLITEIRKTKDKKSKKKENTIIVLVDFNLDNIEKDQLSDLIPIFSLKLTNLSIQDYLTDFNLKLDFVKYYFDLIDKFMLKIKTDCILKEKLTKLYLDENQNLIDFETILNDLESKCKLMFKILNEIRSRVEIQINYLERLNSILKDLSDQRFEKIKSEIFNLQLELVEYARSKLVIDENLVEYNLINSMGFTFLVDILDRFVNLFEI